MVGITVPVKPQIHVDRNTTYETSLTLPINSRPATVGGNSPYLNFTPTKEILVSELHTTIQQEKLEGPQPPFKEEFQVSRWFLISKRLCFISLVLS